MNQRHTGKTQPHSHLFLHFLSCFSHAAWRVRGVIGGQIGLVVLAAWAISWVEKLPFGEALYFSFITGLTIGYGDISPATPAGRVISILIGLVGILFTGIVVAIAVKALQMSWQESEAGGHNDDNRG